MFAWTSFSGIRPSLEEDWYVWELFEPEGSSLKVVWKGEDRMFNVCHELDKADLSIDDLKTKMATLPKPNSLSVGTVNWEGGNQLILRSLSNKIENKSIK
jgi:hypothetical protein